MYTRHGIVLAIEISLAILLKKHNHFAQGSHIIQHLQTVYDHILYNVIYYTLGFPLRLTRYYTLA